MRNSLPPRPDPEQNAMLQRERARRKMEAETERAIERVKPMTSQQRDECSSLSNRQRAQAAKHGKFWCSYCDWALVGQYGRCRNCGHKENPKEKKVTL